MTKTELKESLKRIYRGKGGEEDFELIFNIMLEDDIRTDDWGNLVIHTKIKADSEREY